MPACLTIPSGSFGATSCKRPSRDRAAWTKSLTLSSNFGSSFRCAAALRAVVQMLEHVPQGPVISPRQRNREKIAETRATFAQRTVLHSKAQREQMVQRVLGDDVNLEDDQLAV